MTGFSKIRKKINKKLGLIHNRNVTGDILLDENEQQTNAMQYLAN